MFGGGGSIQLARVFGIRIGVEPSWFLVLFLIIWSLTGYYGDLFPGEGTSAFVLAVVSALLFFGSIVLHELGHAVVAMRNGIGIAGHRPVAVRRRGQDGARHRLGRRGVPGGRGRPGGHAADRGWSASAPATLIAGSGDGGRLGRASTRSPATRRWRCSAGWRFVNALLLVFNLIPGFPLDGGRIARAIAWKAHRRPQHAPPASPRGWAAGSRT